MSHLYTDTIPRMPRGATKRGIVARAGHVERLEAKAKAEKAARQKAERELRVLRRIRFRWKDQPLHVQASLTLIGHVSP